MATTAAALLGRLAPLLRSPDVWERVEGRPGRSGSGALIQAPAGLGRAGRAHDPAPEAVGAAALPQVDH